MKTTKRALITVAVIAGAMLAARLTVVLKAQVTAQSFTAYSISYHELVYDEHGLLTNTTEYLEAQRRNGDKAAIGFRSNDHKSYTKSIML